MTRFSKALLASLCLHGLLLGAYVAFSVYEPAVKLSSPSIQVTLAKLGKPRDEKLLPRFDASQASQSVETKSETKKIAAPKKQNPLDILKKRFGKPSNEGKQHGSAQGTSLTSELADSYEAQVLELLRSNYEIPRIISDREAKYLKLLIKLWIGPRGELLKISVEQPSKNIRFDQAVLTGSKKISSFGAPPLQLARKYRTEGLLIQFCPLECL
ncbi:MAG: TonB C-terminal domain-containing protein [Myxococcaceae bacterium]